MEKDLIMFYRLDKTKFKEPFNSLVGEFRKNLHPRSVEFAGFHEISFQIIWQNRSWIWLFRVNLLIVAGWSNLQRSGILNLRSSGIMNLRNYVSRPPKFRSYAWRIRESEEKIWSRESAKIWNHEPAKIWNHEPAKTWNLEPAKLWNQELAKLCVQTPEILELWVKDSGIWGKPSQRRKFKQSGFSVWTSGRLVNVWYQPCKSRDVKDLHVHVHTRNIP
jgi:hypothetical protein